MTSYKVMENFKEIMEEIVENVRLTTKDNEDKKPQVLLGYLEPLEADKEEKDDFPYVLIRYMNGDSQGDNRSINLKLIFGVYSNDINGWVDILHLFEITETALLKRKVFDFYVLDETIKKTIPEEQPYPYFYGFMELKFEIPQIEMEGDTNVWLP